MVVRMLPCAVIVVHVCVVNVSATILSGMWGNNVSVTTNSARDTGEKSVEVPSKDIAPVIIKHLNQSANAYQTLRVKPVSVRYHWRHAGSSHLTLFAVTKASVIVECVNALRDIVALYVQSVQKGNAWVTLVLEIKDVLNVVDLAKLGAHAIILLVARLVLN
jgi:hypothetical protein